MLFNSLSFLLFFAVVIPVYFLLPNRFRWAFLLLSSCYFYMTFIPIYIFILFFTIGIDFLAGVKIENSTGKRRKLFLQMSILANVGVLAFFKYFNFANETLRHLLSRTGFVYAVPSLAIVLPIGLSFHTFQSLAYTIEVYKGRQKAERHIGILATYVMFWPQLVAGPIERPQNLLLQFREPHAFRSEDVTAGLELMLLGFFKKVVIADRLAIFVNHVYDKPQSFRGLPLILSTVFFSFQIYCDFSGYSDIALGTARIMGFRLMKNFNRPYLSASLAEFWGRWHISLSTWFRDYVYIPLGGNRVPKSRWAINLMITFLLSGLWHGANWTYVMWGGLNGAYLLAELFFAGKIEALPALLRRLLVFTAISFAWIFFRANSSRDAFYICQHLFSDAGHVGTLLRNHDFIRENILFNQSRAQFVIAVFLIFALLLTEGLSERINLWQRLTLSPTWLRWSLYYAGVFVILAFGSFYNSQQFIYFQF